MNILKTMAAALLLAVTLGGAAAAGPACSVGASCDTSVSLTAFMDIAKQREIPMVVVQGEADLALFDEVVRSEKPTVVMPKEITQIVFTLKEGMDPQAFVPVAVFTADGQCYRGKGQFQRYILDKFMVEVTKDQS